MIKNKDIIASQKKLKETANVRAKITSQLRHKISKWRRRSKT